MAWRRASVSIRRGRRSSRGRPSPPGKAGAPRGVGLDLRGARRRDELALAVESSRRHPRPRPPRGLPDDAIDGFDRDVILECRKARLPLLRYPGELRVGLPLARRHRPRERRPSEEPAGTSSSTTRGTDEYVSFCRAVDCEPMICVNAGTARPRRPRPGSSTRTPRDEPLASCGAERPPRPYGIKIWRSGTSSTETGRSALHPEIRRRYLRFAKAIKPPTFHRPHRDGCAGLGGKSSSDAGRVRSLRSIRSSARHSGRRGSRGLPGPHRLPDAVRRRRGGCGVARSAASPAGRRHGAAGLHDLPPALELDASRRPSSSALHPAAVRSGREMITHSASEPRRGLAKWRAWWSPSVPARHVLYATMTGVRPVPVEVTCATYASRESQSSVEGPRSWTRSPPRRLGRELTLVAIKRGRGEIAAPWSCAGGAPRGRSGRDGSTSFLHDPERRDRASRRGPRRSTRRRWRRPAPSPPALITEVVRPGAGGSASRARHRSRAMELRRRDRRSAPPGSTPLPGSGDRGGGRCGRPRQRRGPTPATSAPSSCRLVRAPRTGTSASG